MAPQIRPQGIFEPRSGYFYHLALVILKDETALTEAYLPEIGIRIRLLG